ncbi:M1 family metallopeptidase [Rhodococcus sp. X156]|uniref:M1 family metallopeptidase n=1 Tax=Rhodococcus sp. X156 TaxID=2499145 RepID=UPI001F49D1EB|nr:M1 family metallopeptidase [Rhodococcus sp. X156]
MKSRDAVQLEGSASVGDPYVPERGNGGYSVTRYELDLDYRVASNRLSGRARLSAVTTQSLKRFSLDLAGLTVSKVSVNGTKATKFAQRDDKLYVSVATPLPVGATLTVDVHYTGAPTPVTGPWGEVGWEELTDGVIVASQPDGARSWFPCDDHPSAKASFRTTITTDSPYTVFANGTLTSQRTRSSRTTWVFEQPEPMACYLATVQVGQYESTTLTESGVVQRVLAPSALRSAVAHDFARQPQMMALFERLFGPYPFAAYTVVVTGDPLEIPVEAQGASIFGANHVDGGRGWERLVAHELAHQWFGNSLTVRGWQHIWLNEGFACYAEWLWSEECGGPTAARLAEQARTQLARLPQDLLLADPQPERMFDDRLYKRGALLLHALRGTLGDEAFFALLREWTTRYRYLTVTTHDFIDLAGAHAGQPLRELFTAWLDQPKLPSS